MNDELIQQLVNAEIGTLALIILLVFAFIFFNANKSGSKTVSSLLEFLTTLTKVQEGLERTIEKLQENDNRRLDLEKERVKQQELIYKNSNEQLQQIVIMNKTLKDYHGSFDSTLSTFEETINHRFDRLERKLDEITGNSSV